MDVPAISHLYLEVAEEVVRREPHLRHVPDPIDIERRYASRVDEANRAVLIAPVDGNVVAFVDAALIRHSDASTYNFLLDLTLLANRRPSWLQGLSKRNWAASA